MRYPKTKTRSGGWTFVEITIVVSLVIILVGIALPSFIAFKNRSREEVKETAIMRVEEAKLKFYLANKTASALVAEPTPADLVLHMPDPGMGTNAFYNGVDSLFPGVFPNEEVWMLDPEPRGVRPTFRQITP